MLEVHFKIDSNLGKLAKLALELGTTAEPLLAASHVVDRAIQKNFDEEGRPEPWWPLEDKYEMWKAENYPGRGILERTGRLRRSISTHVEMGASFSPPAIVARTDVGYGALHQYGDHQIPPRPFLVLTDEDQEEMSVAIAESFSRLASRP